ncbi:MAG: hypothetical protein Q4C87_01505 [Actinomycetaceae bacterium]|nr:hypothetical protein [Actinomycetaceae bacterium]
MNKWIPFNSDNGDRSSGSGDGGFGSQGPSGYEGGADDFDATAGSDSFDPNATAPFDAPGTPGAFGVGAHAADQPLGSEPGAFGVETGAFGVEPEGFNATPGGFPAALPGDFPQDFGGDDPQDFEDPDGVFDPSATALVTPIDPSEDVDTNDHNPAAGALAAGAAAAGAAPARGNRVLAAATAFLPTNTNILRVLTAVGAAFTVVGLVVLVMLLNGTGRASQEIADLEASAEAARTQAATLQSDAATTRERTQALTEARQIQEAEAQSTGTNAGQAWCDAVNRDSRTKIGEHLSRYDSLNQWGKDKVAATCKDKKDAVDASSAVREQLRESVVISSCRVSSDGQITMKGTVNYAGPEGVAEDSPLRKAHLWVDVYAQSGEDDETGKAIVELPDTEPGATQSWEATFPAESADGKCRVREIQWWPSAL